VAVQIKQVRNHIHKRNNTKHSKYKHPLLCTSKLDANPHQHVIQNRVSDSRLSFLVLPKPVLAIHFTKMQSKMVTKFIIHRKSFLAVLLLCWQQYL
jgi:hypothetical protein